MSGSVVHVSAVGVAKLLKQNGVLESAKNMKFLKIEPRYQFKEGETMNLKDEILALFIEVDEHGNKWYPAGHHNALIRVGELVEAHEQELQSQIDQFKPHGYLSPDGDMTSMNFDGCKRLYVKKDRP